MVSWKLCAAVLVFTVLALAAESEARRGSRDRNRDRGEGGRRGGGGRRGSRGRGGGRGRGSSGGRGRGGGRGRTRCPRLGRLPNLSRMRPSQMMRRVEDLIAATSEFSFNFYNETASRSPDNFVISPLSVFSAMTMVHAGACGDTQTQISSALNLRPNIHLGIKLYASSMAALNSTSQTNLANAVYVKRTFRMSPKYRNHVRFFYNSEANVFAESSPEVEINNWVENQTRGEIVDFLEAGSIMDSTMMFLVNVVYFKGKWKEPFTLTNVGQFQVAPGRSHPVFMMSNNGQYRSTVSATLQATIVEIPYAEERFACYIFLPNPDTTLTDMEGRLNANQVNTELTNLSQTNASSILLTIPKFGLDTNLELNEVLQSMGVVDLFSSQANLKKISRSRRGAPRLKVDKVLHRVVIEVDEEGTVAAGATGITIVRLSLPMQVTVNRPFSFILRDRVKGVNFFMGRYVNPMGENLKE